MPTLFNLQFFGNFVLVVMNALFSIFLIRFLSNDDYGIYGFLISFLAVSLFITNFGFSGVIQKRIPLSSDSEKSGIFFKFIIIKGIAQLLFTVSIGLYLFLYGLFEFKLIILFSIFLFLGNLNNFILSNFFIINLQQKSSFYNLIFVSGIKIILLFCFNYFFSIGILQIFLIMAIAELLSFFISTFSWPAIKNRKKPSSKVLNEAKPFFLTKIAVKSCVKSGFALEPKIDTEHGHSASYADTLLWPRHPWRV